LPSGHPDISKLQQSAFGTLTIKAVQGTEGGPKPVGDKVTVELYNSGHAINTAEAVLDADGSLVAENVPIGVPVQPVVKIAHAGAEYQGVGEVLEAAHPKQTIEVAVYETTEQEPAWTVKMRHVMLRPGHEPDTITVIEMLALENPADRAWLGKANPADGKRVTLELPLPAGARDIQLSGALHECCASVKYGKVINTMALVPGATEVQVSYVLPVAEGRAELTVTAPTSTGHLMLFGPDDGSTVTGEGLIAAGSANMAPGQGPTRYFMLPGMQAGKTLRVALAGIPKTKAAAATTEATVDETVKPPQQPAKASSLAALVGGACAVILVGGVLAIFLKPAAKTPAARARRLSEISNLKSQT
jgi:hypothetical protein